MADLRYWAMLEAGVLAETLAHVDVDAMVARFRDEISRARRKKGDRLPLSLLPVQASFDAVIDLSVQRGGPLSPGQLQHLLADSFPRVYPLKETVSTEGRILHVATASAFWTGSEAGLIAITRLSVADDRFKPSELVSARVETYDIDPGSDGIPEPVSRALEGIYQDLRAGTIPILHTSAPRPRRALVLGPEKPLLPHVSGWAQLLQGAFYLRGIEPVFYFRAGDKATEVRARIANEDFDVMVSWQPVPGGITHNLHTAFGSTHIAEQLMVIEDATFESMMHSLRGELDARIALWNDIVPEPSQPDDPANVEEALRQAAAKCVRLKFADAIFIQARTITYPQPRRIRDDVIAFDRLVDEIARGLVQAGRLDQVAATRGVIFSRFISDTQARSGAYDIQIEGEKRKLGPHLKFGYGLPKNIARIYMVEVANGEFYVCDIRPH
jgi:hypothetical protein